MLLIESLHWNDKIIKLELRERTFHFDLIELFKECEMSEL